MPKYQTEIAGVRREIDVPTGDYMRVAVMATALADADLPCSVHVWCDDVLPDYGPYWYTVAIDCCGRLRCGSQMEH